MLQHVTRLKINTRIIYKQIHRKLWELRAADGSDDDDDDDDDDEDDDGYSRPVWTLFIVSSARKSLWLQL